MAVPIQNLRSGTATKRPVASGLAFGQVAVNFNEADPAVYLRGDANALIKVSPVFVGSGAPNATPASGGSAGNSKGEQWLDTAFSPPAPKVFDGSAFVNSYTFASGTTLIQPIVTSGTISNSTISGSTIIDAIISGITTTATGNAVIKPATNILEIQGDAASVVGQIQLNCHVNTHGQKIASQPHAQAATNTLTLPGGTTIGNGDAVLVSNIGTQTLTNKTLTSPTLTTPALGTPSSGTLTNCTFPTLNQNTTGNAATVTTNANLTGDVTSAGNATAIAANVIVDADINASAGIVDTKLATIATAGKVSNSATTATNANTASAIVARDGSGNFTAGTITAALTGTASGNLVSGGALGTPSAGTLTNCTGLPIGGLTASTSTSLGVGSIELGNASDTTLSRSAAGVLAVEGVVIPSISSTSTLTNKTLTDPAIIGTILEDVFTITDGAAFEVDPGNGSIQLITLGASRTPKCTNFVAGESVTLMINDGSAFTLTWTDATWGAGGVIWRGGTAPTLALTGFSVIQFWKVSTQVYGASVGNVA